MEIKITIVLPLDNSNIFAEILYNKSCFVFQVIKIFFTSISVYSQCSSVRILVRNFSSGNKTNNATTNDKQIQKSCFLKFQSSRSYLFLILFIVYISLQLNN